MFQQVDSSTSQSRSDGHHSAVEKFSAQARFKRTNFCNLLSVCLYLTDFFFVFDILLCVPVLPDNTHRRSQNWVSELLLQGPALGDQSRDVECTD